MRKTGIVSPVYLYICHGSHTINRVCYFPCDDLIIVKICGLRLSCLFTFVRPLCHFFKEFGGRQIHAITMQPLISLRKINARLPQKMAVLGQRSTFYDMLTVYGLMGFEHLFMRFEHLLSSFHAFPDKTLDHSGSPIRDGP